MVNLIERAVRGIREFIFGTTQTNEEQDSFEVEDFGIIDGPEVRQKIITRTLYCSGEQQEYFARTFEQNKRDRRVELERALEAKTISICSPPSISKADIGYSDGEVPRSETDSQFFYPEIEVGVR